MFKGVFVEHMMFYLAKSGGDPRFFPELMPHKWFCEIYDIKFKVYDILQSQKRAKQEAGLLREVIHDYHPHDMEHDGEAYYSKMIQKMNTEVENLVGTLMGNYIFLSDAIP